jgi:broad specificity phosphatase PhoE
MRTLILIKHATPRIEPDVPASQWQLSAEGRLQCGRLADALAPYAPEVIFCSVEPKAQETAELLSQRLSVPCESIEGLHEHERDNAPYLPQVEFERLVGEVLRQPERLVFGTETGRDAFRRFDRAVAQVLAGTDARRIAVVAHGTVISLFAEKHVGCDPAELWRQLACPSLVVMNGPPWRIQAISGCI